MTQTIFTRDHAKARAKEIRAEFASSGNKITHSQSLEKVAQESGFVDWNTMSARLGNAPELTLNIGDLVGGHYLKQPFEGRVIAIRQLDGGSALEITLDFDEPVDVVTFDSFSAFRKRVNATISSSGVSFAKTSDGIPQMVIERVGNMLV